jgi:hypothetical protein
MNIKNYYRTLMECSSSSLINESCVKACWVSLDILYLMLLCQALDLKVQFLQRYFKNVAA